MVLNVIRLEKSHSASQPARFTKTFNKIFIKNHIDLTMQKQNVMPTDMSQIITPLLCIRHKNLNRIENHLSLKMVK